MSKHDWLKTIAPVAVISAAFLGMYCGAKRRFMLLAVVLSAWVVFSIYMMGD
jgi:hypothetical protein